MLLRTSREMELERGRAPSEFVQGGVGVYCVCCVGVQCDVWCERVVCAR